LIHAVKQEVNLGYPTGGTAHTTAYDFFTQHPECAFQLLNVLSDLGIPRDVSHMAGFGVHTYRFINAAGQSTLFKWYWLPVAGLRSLVYDEVQVLAGKNANFQRVDLHNLIESGIYPEYELAVQMFPDDGTYMWNGYDLLVPTEIIPFEELEPVKLGKLTVNRNFNNWFSEPEQISFAPSNVVDGVTFVPDPLLQWRLMSYDEYEHPNQFIAHPDSCPALPHTVTIRPMAICYPSTDQFQPSTTITVMATCKASEYILSITQRRAADTHKKSPKTPNTHCPKPQFVLTRHPRIFVGDSISTPNDIGGVVAAGPNETLAYAPASGISAGSGNIGRYYPYDPIEFAQARLFWNTMDVYAQQHTVDAYRFELGNVANTTVVQLHIDNFINKIDNCLARRVAYGVGMTLPALGSGPMSNSTSMNMSSGMYPSLYPLNPGNQPNKTNAGLTVAVLASDTMFTPADMSAMMPLLEAQQVSLAVVGPRMGMLNTGVNATQSYLTASSVFYDAVFVASASNTSSSSSGNSTDCSSMSLDAYSEAFLMQAYMHGKPLGAIGACGDCILMSIGAEGMNSSLGLYAGDAGTVTSDVLQALMGPARFPQRFPTDDVEAICGMGSMM
jgi:catalase